MKNHMSTAFFGLADKSKFVQGVQQAIDAMGHQKGIYAGDNLSPTTEI